MTTVVSIDARFSLRKCKHNKQDATSRTTAEAVLSGIAKCTLVKRKGAVAGTSLEKRSRQRVREDSAERDCQGLAVGECNRKKKRRKKKRDVGIHMTFAAAAAPEEFSAENSVEVTMPLASRILHF